MLKRTYESRKNHAPRGCHHVTDQHTSVYVTDQHTSAYDTDQHTSAYVTDQRGCHHVTDQHTSAYVTDQHKSAHRSAYVSIRSTRREAATKLQFSIRRRVVQHTLACYFLKSYPSCQSRKYADFLNKVVWAPHTTSSTRTRVASRGSMLTSSTK